MPSTTIRSPLTSFRFKPMPTDTAHVLETLEHKLPYAGLVLPFEVQMAVDIDLTAGFDEESSLAEITCYRDVSLGQ